MFEDGEIQSRSGLQSKELPTIKGRQFQSAVIRALLADLHTRGLYHARLVRGAAPDVGIEFESQVWHRIPLGARDLVLRAPLLLYPLEGLLHQAPCLLRVLQELRDLRVSQGLRQAILRALTIRAEGHRQTGDQDVAVGAEKP